MTETALQAPVKGLVFKHSRRTSWGPGGVDVPMVCTVTSVTPEKVFYSTALYSGGPRMKMPRHLWEKMVLEVVSVPEPKAPERSKAFTARQALALHRKAHEIGMAAGEHARPATMIVGSPTTPLGSDIDPRKPVYAVMDGVCGFAYVKVAGNTSFGRRMREAGLFRSAYYGGLSMSVGAFGQSMERKVAYARAYAEVLEENGVPASYESRMD